MKVDKLDAAMNEMLEDIIKRTDLNDDYELGFRAGLARAYMLIASVRYESVAERLNKKPNAKNETIEA